MAPCTCGAHRSEYASCTRSHQRCDSMIAEPSSSRSTFAAESTWPRQRAQRLDLRDGSALREPCSASSESAQARSAAFASRRARTSAERAHRGHELRAVDQREALLGDQPDRARGRPRASASAAGTRTPSNHASPSPTSGSARCASGARSPLAPTEPRLGTYGSTPAVQALEQQLDGLDARARVPLRQRVRAQQHRGTHDLRCIRISDAAGVGAKQPQLQLLRELLGDRLRDESAEAGVDPVGVLPRAVGCTLDELPRAPHLLARIVAERCVTSFDRDVPDVVDGEVLAGQPARVEHAETLAPRARRVPAAMMPA